MFHDKWCGKQNIYSHLGARIFKDRAREDESAVSRGSLLCVSCATCYSARKSSILFQGVHNIESTLNKNCINIKTLDLLSNVDSIVLTDDERDLLCLILFCSGFRGKTLQI